MTFGKFEIKLQASKHEELDGKLKYIAAPMNRSVGLGLFQHLYHLFKLRSSHAADELLHHHDGVLRAKCLLREMLVERDACLQLPVYLRSMDRNT